jgi:hypothetical protein
MERDEIRGYLTAKRSFPDCAALHPGYLPQAVTQSAHPNRIALGKTRSTAPGHASARIQARHCRVLVFGLGWGASEGMQHVFHWLHQYFVR